MSDLPGPLPSNDIPASHFQRAPRSVVDPIPVLDAAQSVQVQIEVLKETYDEILKVLKEQDLDEEEGMRTVLLTGLGYMDARLHLDQINGAIDGSEAQARLVQRLVQDLASYHSMYSVLKFKAFKLYKLAQTLEFNVSGLRATERMWGEWADRMRRERAELQAEVIKLKSLMSEFDADLDLFTDPSILASVRPQPVLQIEPLPEPVARPHQDPDTVYQAPFWVRLWKRLLGK